MQPFPENATVLAKNLTSKENRPLGCRTEACPDVAQAVCDSLAHPLGFDSLGQLTVRGDHVVLAVADGLPCMEQIVEGVVQSLVDAGTDPDNITVLLSENYADRLDGLRLRSAEPVHWAWHDPDLEEEMAYLATTDEGRPIVLNRLLTDADLVIPLGCFRTGIVYDHFGVHTPIFPTFTNRRTMAEFGQIKSQDSRGRRHKRHIIETDRIGWLLGAVFSIQVIPGTSGQIVEVIAGEVEQVRQESLRAYRQAWHHQIPGQVGLVVSVIDDMTGWSDLVQTLSDMIPLVEPDGAAVILTHFAAEPGPALHAWIEAQDPDETLLAIRDSKLEDAATTLRLAELTEQRKIYLMSGLEEQMVEDLRMTPIASTDEIVRLSERFSSALILEGVPFVTVEISSS